QALRVASQGANTSILLALAPRALAEELLRQIEERRRRQDASKIDRIRPGDPPRVRMPSIENPSGVKPERQRKGRSCQCRSTQHPKPLFRGAANGRSARKP